MTDPTPTLSDERCPNCGGLLIGASHQTSCLSNAAAEIERLRRMVAEAEQRALREAAKEARVRGDIGKDCGPEVWDWLQSRADRIGGDRG